MANGQAVANRKKADKEKIEMLRLGNGDMELGVKLYQQRMQKDKDRKAKKDEREMALNAGLTFEFWNWASSYTSGNML